MANEKKIYEIPIYRENSITPDTPVANFRKIYPKSDGWYILDSSGTEARVLAGPWELDANPNGALFPTTNDAQDLGKSANRIRDIYMGSMINVATGLVVTDQASPDSPQSLLHIYDSDGSTVTPIAGTLLTLESAEDAYITFKTANFKESGLYWATQFSSSSSFTWDYDAGSIFKFNIAGADRIYFDSQRNNFLEPTAFGALSVGIDGMVHIQGAGDTSATKGLVIKNNSDNANNLIIYDDGKAFHGNGVSIGSNAPGANTGLSVNGSNSTFKYGFRAEADYDVDDAYGFWSNMDHINTVSPAANANIGAWLNAANADFNYALITDNGIIGFGTETPEEDAVVTMEAHQVFPDTYRGLLPPRVTTTNRNLIGGGTPTEGMTVYNETTKDIEFWDGSAWGGTAGAGTTISGLTEHVVTRGNAAGDNVLDGTWAFTGNDIYPLTTGSNIGQGGSPGNRVDTIYMASTIDYESTLNLSNGGTSRFSIDSVGTITHNTPENNSFPVYTIKNGAQNTVELWNTNTAGGALLMYTESGTIQTRLGGGTNTYVNNGFNFGVNTSSPTSPLTVNAANDAILLRNASSENQVSLNTHTSRGGGIIMWDLDGTTEIVNFNQGGDDYINTGNDLRIDESDLILKAADTTINNFYTDSPDLILRGTYDSDGSSPVTSANFDATIRHNMETAGPTSILEFLIGGTDIMQMASNGNVSIGTTNETTARLRLRGSGSTSVTKALLVENSSGSAALTVNDDIGVVIGGTNDFGFGFVVNGTTAFLGTTHRFDGEAQFNGSTNHFDNDVSIGFTSGSAMLNVYGDGVADTMNVKTAGSANFPLRITTDGLIGFTDDNSNSPNANSIVTIKSDTGGFGSPLAYRAHMYFTPMTASRASAISSPTNGMLVNVSDTDATFTSIGFWVYESGAWTKLAVGAGGDPNVAITDDVIPKGTGSTTEDSSWKIVGDDLMPTAEPSNIGSSGSPAFRVDTIYMDSVIDFASDLIFEEDGAERGRWDSDSFVIGHTTAASKLHIRGTGTTTGKTILTEDSSGNDTFFVQDDGWAVHQVQAATDSAPIWRTRVGSNNVAEIYASASGGLDGIFFLRDTGGTFNVKLGDTGANDYTRKTTAGTPRWTLTDDTSGNHVVELYNAATTGGQILLKNQAGTITSSSGSLTAKDYIKKDTSGQPVYEVRDSAASAVVYEFYNQATNGGLIQLKKQDTTITTKLGGASDNYTLNDWGVGIASTSARLHVTGSGSTSGTRALLVENSSSLEMLKITNDSTISAGGDIILVDGTAVSDDSFVNSPLLNLRGKYDSDDGSPSATVSANFDATLQTIVETAGPSPTGRLAIEVQGTEHFSIDNTGRVVIPNESDYRFNLLTLGTSTGGVKRAGIQFNDGNTNPSTIYDSSDGTNNAGLTFASRDGNFQFGQSSSGFPNDSAVIHARTIQTQIVGPLLFKGAGSSATFLELRGGPTPNDVNDGIKMFTYDDSDVKVERFQIEADSADVKAYFHNITSLGVGTNSPAADSAMDVTSTTGGFLPPRMTTTERDLIGIGSPLAVTAGMVIFNTTTNKHQGFDGTVWNDFY